MIVWATLLAGCLTLQPANSPQTFPEIPKTQLGGENTGNPTANPTTSARGSDAIASLPAPTFKAPDIFPKGSGSLAGPTKAQDLTRIDFQGMVQVTAKPLNLDAAMGTLDFEITLNTHSVDLSMDLSQLSTLSTDTGKSVSALSWEAPRGGHHVSGMLSFPAEVDGQPLLEGARELILTIREVDAEERTFTWELSQ